MTKQISKIVSYFACVIIGIFIGSLISFLYQSTATFIFGRVIEAHNSPDGKHMALLLRKSNLSDFNFVLKLDGEKVFESPDLCANENAFREALIWDKTGRVMVLELMGKRVFAYDVEKKKALEKDELNQYQLFPIEAKDSCFPLKDIDE